MRFLSALLLLFMLRCALADSPAPPRRFVTTSRSKAVLFTMLPAQWTDAGEPTRKMTRAPFGTAYELQDDGTLKKLWTVKGWYAFQVFISDNGRYLVRLGPWPIGDKPSKDHLGVAFYEDGNLLAEYSTAELVKDHTKVLPTVSHYFWLGRPEKDGEEVLSYANRDDTFRLKTIDGIEYTFDAKTGKIVK